MDRMKNSLIKIDYDTHKKTFARINNVIYFLRLDVVDCQVQRTRHGYHVQLEIRNKVNDFEIIILQCLMQSDYKREMFNLLRVHSGKFPKQSWNVLFKKKWSFDLKQRKVS